MCLLMNYARGLFFKVSLSFLIVALYTLMKDLKSWKLWNNMTVSKSVIILIIVKTNDPPFYKTTEHSQYWIFLLHIYYFGNLLDITR